MYIYCVYIVLCIYYVYIVLYISVYICIYKRRIYIDYFEFRSKIFEEHILEELYYRFMGEKKKTNFLTSNVRDPLNRENKIKNKN